MIIPATGAAAVAPATLNDDGTVTVDVAFISDFHGWIQPTNINRVDYITGLGVACTIEQMRAANPDTVFLSNGDAVGGSAFASAVLDDNPTLDFLDLLKVDASNVGNHEFDKGFNDLATRITQNVEFPFISANISGEQGGIDAIEVLAPWYMYETNGVTIAFVGTTTTDTPSLVSPNGVAGISFADIYDTTNSTAAALSDGNPDNGEADVVIAMTHSGSEALDVSKYSGDVDAVFTGHTHLKYTGTAANGAGVSIPVIEPWDFGRGVGHLEVTIDPATGDHTIGTAEVIETNNCTTASQEVVDFIAANKAAADVAGQVPVGNISADILRGAGDNRGAESTLGNFLGDVALYQANLTQSADIGVINPGGIRASYNYSPDGVLSYSEVFTVQPFANSVGVVDVTGAQFVQLLEQQWRDGESRPMLRLGLSENVSYQFDSTKPYGERVTAVFIDGAPIDPAATYTVASNNFLLTGGDQFTVLRDGQNHIDTGMIDVDGTIEWFREHGTASPNYAQRSIGLTDVSGHLTSGKAGVGDTVAFNLSSLLFTNGETAPTVVTVKVAGTTIGTFPIDSAVTAGLDESGKATVSFRVPASLSGKTGDVEVFLGTASGQKIVSAPVTIGAEPTSGVFVNNEWDGAHDWIAAVLPLGGELISGDWDGDGVDTFGVRVGTTFYLTNNTRGGSPTITFNYGNPGDVIHVGDWNGDGKDTLMVQRSDWFYVRNTLTSGKADVTFSYGNPGDDILIGDWDGDGKDTLAVQRNDWFYVRNSVTTGVADAVFNYGNPGDIILVGDWDGDGKDTLGVRRDITYYLRNSVTTGVADIVTRYGNPTDIVIVGDWDGDGIDTLAVDRR